MTNQNLTEILIVLDRSGSMSGVRNPTVESLNNFIKDQQKFPGKANLSILQFDTEFDYIRESIDLSNIKPLEITEYEPRGSTALYDAICMGIDKLGNKLANLPENERASKIMCVILTDGEENASLQYTRTNVQERVERQTKDYNWQFIYLGANQDAIMSARTMGISGGNAANYVGTKSGTNVAFAAAAMATNSYRLSGVCGQSLMANNQNLTEDLDDIK